MMGGKGWHAPTLKAKRGRGKNPATASNLLKLMSERVPGRVRREFQLAEINAQARTDTGADRHHHHFVGGQSGKAKAGDKIS